MSARKRQPNHQPVRRSSRRSMIGGGAAAIALAVFASGCSNGYADPKGAALAGTDGQVSQVEIADLRLATAAEGEPARFIGTLANQASIPLEITFSDDDDQTSVVVPATSTLDLIENPVMLETADVQPGTIMTVMIGVASDEEAVELPVVDGFVDEYGDIVPNDAEE